MRGDGQDQDQDRGQGQGQGQGNGWTGMAEGSGQVQIVQGAQDSGIAERSHEYVPRGEERVDGLGLGGQNSLAVSREGNGIGNPIMLHAPHGGNENMIENQFLLPPAPYPYEPNNGHNHPNEQEVAVPQHAIEATAPNPHLLNQLQLGNSANPPSGQGRIKYARGATYSDRHLRRLRRKEEERKKAAIGTLELTSFFAPKTGSGESREAQAQTQTQTETQTEPITIPPPLITVEAIKTEKRAAAIRDLEALLDDSEKRPQSNTHYRRHQAVLSLLQRTQDREPGSVREEMALDVAQSLNMGSHFAKKIVTWERSWIESREIEEDMRGRNPKPKKYPEAYERGEVVTDGHEV